MTTVNSWAGAFTRFFTLMHTITRTHTRAVRNAPSHGVGNTGAPRTSHIRFSLHLWLEWVKANLLFYHLPSWSRTHAWWHCQVLNSWRTLHNMDVLQRCSELFQVGALRVLALRCCGKHFCCTSTHPVHSSSVLSVGRTPKIQAAESEGVCIYSFKRYLKVTSPQY